MTDHNREDLIEQAAKALLDSEGIEPEEDGTYWGAGTWPNAVKDARTCWAVFEQAHTPSDDEREAPIQVVSEAFEKHESAPTWWDDPVGRDAALRWHMRGFKDGLNFRRTVQGEPSDAEVRRAAVALVERDNPGAYERGDAVPNYDEYEAAARAALRAAAEAERGDR